MRRWMASSGHSTPRQGSHETTCQSVIPSQALSETELFLDIRGSETKSIMLFSNDFSGVNEIVHKSVDVPESALVLRANYPSQK